MPLFKRNHDRQGGGEARRPAAAPRAARAGEPVDWRSYGPVAQDYARVQAPRTALPAADLVALAGVQSGARVLDVGTGTGVVARVAAEAAGAAGIVVGVDPALGMLAKAAAEGGGARYAAAEAIDLPFRGGAFGFVLSAFALSHFTKYDTALFDMLRVLVPGGRMGVASWGPGDDELTRTWQGVAEEYAEHEILVDARQRATPWQDRFSDPGLTRDTLYEAGLREIRLEPREYRFHVTREDYLLGKETSPTGRFLRYTLGEESWEAFRARARDVFAEGFPETFNDFRDVILAVGTKPAG